MFQMLGDKFHVAASASTGYNDDKPHLIMGIRAGLEMRVRVDGALAGTTTTKDMADVSSVGYPMTIGAHARGDMQQLEGEVYEIVAISSSLPEPQLRALEKYFGDKFALTLPSP